MEPAVVAETYNRIAGIYQQELVDSDYGIQQLKRALTYASHVGNKNQKALDVGCGVGGRLLHLLSDRYDEVTGVDISPGMLELAKQSHPDTAFVVEDICHWQADEHYDFILAWDSLFHLPYQQQEPVLKKLAGALSENGVLIYTLGNDVGEHTDTWHQQDIYYSSIGINKNLDILINNGLNILHMELDQFPERHVTVIASKPGQQELNN